MIELNKLATVAVPFGTYMPDGKMKDLAERGDVVLIFGYGMRKELDQIIKKYEGHINDAYCKKNFPMYESTPFFFALILKSKEVALFNRTDGYLKYD